MLTGRLAPMYCIPLAGHSGRLHNFQFLWKNRRLRIVDPLLAHCTSLACVAVSMGVQKRRSSFVTL
jgi:hypothetical protein